MNARAFLASAAGFMLLLSMTIIAPHVTRTAAIICASITLCSAFVFALLFIYNEVRYENE